MTLEQILAAVERLEPWKARVMCASAAERTAPLFRQLGRPRSMATVEAALDAAWAGMDGRAGAREKRALTRLPEARQDDSHDPEYYAGRMLEILVRALDCTSTGGGPHAIACLECVASLCDDIDVILTAAPGATFRSDAKDPPPPGAFEARELGAQQEVLGRLQAAAPSPPLIDALRRLARERATAYESAVPQLRDRMTARKRP